jgi:hypothetical protein
MVDFEMFTEEGNEACTQALINIDKVIFGDKFVSEAELKKIVKEQIAQVAEDHKEVHDTEPKWHLVDRINMGLEARGYSYRVGRGDL